MQSRSTGHLRSHSSSMNWAFSRCPRRTPRDHIPPSCKNPGISASLRRQRALRLNTPLTIPETIAFLFPGLIERWPDNRGERGLCSNDHNVIDTHGDQVDPHRVVRSIIKAIFNFVPTPSVEDTRIGFFVTLEIEETHPANPPSFVRTSGRKVDSTMGLIRADELVPFFNIHAPIFVRSLFHSRPL